MEKIRIALIGESSPLDDLTLVVNHLQENGAETRSFPVALNNTQVNSVEEYQPAVAIVIGVGYQNDLTDIVNRLAGPLNNVPVIYLTIFGIPSAIPASYDGIYVLNVDDAFDFDYFAEVVKEVAENS